MYLLERSSQAGYIPRALSRPRSPFLKVKTDTGPLDDSGFRDVQYDKLVEWLKKEGAEFDGVSGSARGHVGGGRRLVATRDAKEGDTIIRMPAELWLSHRSILKSSGIAHVIRR